jgi:hypothetical protein
MTMKILSKNDFWLTSEMLNLLLSTTTRQRNSSESIATIPPMVHFPNARLTEGVYTQILVQIQAIIEGWER